MQDLRLRQSISATTRPPREAERHGQHYFFVSEDEFRSMIERNEFLEWAEVHGQRYGTIRRVVDEWRSQGWGVVLVIDVQGAQRVRQICPDAVTIFVRTSSPTILEQRLRNRGSESESAIQRRLVNAQGELARASEFDYQVLNDDLDRAVAEIRSIILAQITEDAKHA